MPNYRDRRSPFRPGLLRRSRMPVFLICLASTGNPPTYNEQLMQTTLPSPTLADHLRHAAGEWPTQIALIADDQPRSFAEWLNECEAVATRLPPGGPILMQAGSSLELARHAVAASLKQRAFWPVEQIKPLPASTPHPAAALIISTSGSEGAPQAVQLGAAQLDAAAEASNQRLPLCPDDLWLACLPLYHIGGQSILWRCARAGGGVLLHDGFEAGQVARDLARYPVSHLSLVPAMLARLLDSGCRPPPSLRYVMVGGAALASALHDRATAAGWPLCPSYGMSETAAQIATHCPSDGPWQAGLVGRPLSGSEIAIDDRGRIRIRGRQVMLSYLGGAGVDAAGWLTTGDLGRIATDGSLTVTGRADDMLISGGRNVHPVEVEACLAACSGVRDVAVTGVPDAAWGDLIVALVVGEVVPEQLLDHARQHLPSAARPRRLVFLDRLPRNATGKLERSALRRIAAEQPEPTSP